MTRAGGASDGRAGGERPQRDAAIRHALLAWYAEHQRELPWRDRRAPGVGARPDPYAVWISEIMLQQTRVETVGPYFERWMQRFPDVATLAMAPLEAVLGAWQGLGYYSRARNLHRAAREVMAADGELPTTRDGWRALPGVGDYTAGAVASIAFGEPVPAVDGNVKRVLARLDAIDADPSRAAFRKAVAARAQALAAGVTAIGADPGDWTQALMELGATVCTPRNPRCATCPVAAHCRALAEGRVAQLPWPTARAKPRAARTWALVVERAEDGRLLVAQRPPEGLLGGLWEFVLVPGGTGEDEGKGKDEGMGMGMGKGTVGFEAEGAVEALLDARALAARALHVAPEAIEAAVPLPPFEHVFSHLRLGLDPLRVIVAGSAAGVGTLDDMDEGRGTDPPVGVVATETGAGRVSEAGGGVDPASARRAGVPPAYAERRWVSRAEIEALPTSVLMDKLLAAYDAARSST